MNALAAPALLIPRTTLPWAVVVSLLVHLLVLFGLAVSWLEKPKPQFKPISIEFLGDLPQSAAAPPPAEVEALAETSQRARTDTTSEQEQRATTLALPTPPGAPPAGALQAEPTPPAPAPTPEPRPAEAQAPPIAVTHPKSLPSFQVPAPAPAEAKRKTPAPRREAPAEPLDLSVPLMLSPSVGDIGRLDREQRKEQRRRQKETGEATVDINTRELKYASYFKGVKQRVEGTWVYPSQAKRQNLQGQLFMQFTIDADGRLLEIEVVNSSGSEVLDQGAVQAVRKAAPFAPLPDTWGLKRLTVRANFEYIMRQFRMGRR